MAVAQREPLRRMKNIPSSVNVGGKRVRIRVVPDMEHWGEYDHDAF
jgi:hypothetical protein